MSRKANPTLIGAFVLGAVALALAAALLLAGGSWFGERRQQGGLGAGVGEARSDRLGPVDDRRGQFEAVEGRLSSKRFAPIGSTPVKAERIGFADAQSHHWVTAQGVVVIEVLVAHGHAKDALAQQVRHGMLDEVLVPKVGEASRKLPDHPATAIHFAKQENSTISAQVATPEIGLHFTIAKVLKSEGLLYTLCHAAGGIWLFGISLSTNTLHQIPTRPHQLV